MRPLKASLFALVVLLAGCSHTGSNRGPDPTNAQELIAAGKPERAIPLLEEQHRKSPADLSVARSLVEAHVKAGSVDGLIARLGQSGPTTAVEHYMLGLAYFARTADA